MIDAIGKPPSGLLNYRLQWLGDYDECVKIMNRSGPVTVPYKGRYCKASFKIADGPVISQQTKYLPKHHSLNITKTCLCNMQRFLKVEKRCFR